MTGSPTIESALILLAGNHPRHWDEIEQIPFGLMDFDGCTLVGNTVRRLLSMGLKKIVIVTSRMSRTLQWLDRHPNVHVAWDPLYADFGAMFAIRQVSQMLLTPFLLIESNLLYEQKLLQMAVQLEPDNAVIVSKKRSPAAAIVAQAIEGRLLNLSQAEESVSATAVPTVVSLGMFKISRKLFAHMLTYAADRSYTNPFLDHTDCINAVSSEVDIRIVQEPNLLWARIQSQMDRNWALRHIFPLIIQQDEQRR